MIETNFKKNSLSIIESSSIKVVRIPNFLSREDRDALYDAVCIEQKTFQTSIHSSDEDWSTKFLAIEPDGIMEGSTDLVHDAVKKLKKRIREQFSDLCEALSIKPFNLSNMPLSIVNGLNGHDGSPHADSVDGRYQISILYYFHKTPKAFRGGDLNFYETDPDSQNAYNEKESFQIELEDNLLIAFPSKTFHGVTQVRSTSQQFEDGRFVVVSFLGS